MPTSMRSHNEPGRRDLSRRPVTHRSEFPPAIPRRVAPQQSPLPLRRLLAYTSLHETDASPCQPTANLSPNFRVSLTGCSPALISGWITMKVHLIAGPVLNS